MKSVGKESCHIKIKYFFVTNKIKGGEMKVLHCPTDKMIADFFTSRKELHSLNIATPYWKSMIRSYQCNTKGTQNILLQ